MRQLSFLFDIFIGLLVATYAIQPTHLHKAGRKNFNKQNFHPDFEKTPLQSTTPFNTSYFPQIVDHYDFYANPNSQTWQQRYLTNTEHWTAGYGISLLLWSHSHSLFTYINLHK